MTTPIPGADPKGTKTVCVVAVLSSRKADFVEAVVRELRERVRQGAAGNGSDRDITMFERRLVRKVAKLDPQLFVTERERERHILSLGTRLENLDRDEVFRQLGGLVEESSHL